MTTFPRIWPHLTGIWPHFHMTTFDWIWPHFHGYDHIWLALSVDCRRKCYKINASKQAIRDSGVRRKFSWGGSFSGIWWSFLFAVRCLWRHNLTSYSCFQSNVLAKFLDIICIFFYIHSPYFMRHSTEYKLLALQVGISKKIYSMLRHSSSLLQNYQAARWNRG